MIGVAMKAWRVALVVLVLAAVWFWPQGPASVDDPRGSASVATSAERSAPPEAAPRTIETNQDRPSLPAFLPPEAHDTLALIVQGGPFPHRQDGAVFQNRERRLPAQARGYYREYTVRTPGERTRGARRIVTGGDPPSQYWYTDDHYASFRRFEVGR
jgi:ribonuclease T1